MRSRTTDDAYRNPRRVAVRTELAAYDAIRALAAAVCKVDYKAAGDAPAMNAENRTWTFAIRTDGKHKYDGTRAR